MDPTTEFIVLTILAVFAVFCVWIRRKCFVLLPKNKKFDNDYIIDFIEWLLISWPPLIPLVGLMRSSGLDMNWYLLPYFGVIIGIFFVWFNTTDDEKKRKQSALTIGVCILLWTVIGILLFLSIIK